MPITVSNITIGGLSEDEYAICDLNVGDVFFCKRLGQSPLIGMIVSDYLNDKTRFILDLNNGKFYSIYEFPEIFCRKATGYVSKKFDSSDEVKSIMISDLAGGDVFIFKYQNNVNAIYMLCDNRGALLDIIINITKGTYIPMDKKSCVNKVSEWHRDLN